MKRIETTTLYRTLGASTLFVIVACWVSWFLLVRPLRQAVRDSREEVASKRRSLTKRGWPLQRQKLEGLLAERKRLLEGDGKDDPGLEARSEQVLYHATSMFRERIRQSFASELSFVKNASNIDFREAFNHLLRQAAAKNIWLSPKVLNLSEETSSPYTYQMLLQVWTVERLLDKVLDARLLVAAHESEKVKVGNYVHPAAKVEVQPIKAYYLTADGGQPYLLEVPVRLMLKGRINDVRNFLATLTAAPDFLPPMHVEILAEAPKPAKRKKEDETMGPDDVRMHVICSAFFAFPYGEIKKAEKKTKSVRDAMPGA